MPHILSRPSAPATKTFLFLQGHPSTFARDLARALERCGHRTLRVNFCVGDVLFGFGVRSMSYRGRYDAWPAYLAKLIAREGVTDVIYYGDNRPYHRDVPAIAAALGVNAYVYEFGYLRPDWLTLEKGGMSGRSHFPTDPARILAIGKDLPQPDLKPRFRHGLAREISNEITYNLATYVLTALYPRYQADRYYNPIMEYLAGIPKQLRVRRMAREADRFVSKLTADYTRYYLVPLQLQCDYQLRRNAPFAHQADVIDTIIGSFANNAPADSQLIFKCHPLDNGAEGWPRHIQEASTWRHVSDRVHYIEGGDLITLLRDAEGVVLINSTVGMQALQQGCPVMVLGTALYDIDGATHQDTLDSFWAAPQVPDEDLVGALIKAMAATIQVKGSFFAPEGRTQAIAAFVKRLTEGSVNGHGAYVSPPPRSQP